MDLFFEKSGSHTKEIVKESKSFEKLGRKQFMGQGASSGVEFRKVAASSSVKERVKRGSIPVREGNVERSVVHKLIS